MRLPPPPRHRPRRATGGRLRAAAALGVALLTLASGLITAPAARAQPLTSHSVTITVDEVSQSTPTAGTTATPLSFQLTLTNRSDQSLDNLQVHAERGNPIGGQLAQRALDAAMAHPAPPDPGLAGLMPASTPVTTSLTPSQTTSVSYDTTSSIVNDGTGLCICHDAIYPIWFTVTYTNDVGQTTTVGTAQTYLPAFDHAPRPVQVSWLWPLIDRPHRLLDSTVFSDDNLAISVANGRLARVLQVAEMVSGSVPMTLVVDPELIAELAVMSTGKYRVRSGTTTVPGAGAVAASRWLGELRAVLDTPGVELAFTPPADPDFQSLTANGLEWRSSFDADEQATVVAALGGRTATQRIVWPVGEAVDSATLAALARHGASTVVLNEHTLPARGQPTVAPDSLAPVQTEDGPLLAAVSSASVERYVGPVLSTGGKGYALLPQLVAQVAVRAVEDGSRSHYLLITPPRDIDPVPEIAARAIRDTAATSWSSPLPLAAATAIVHPVRRSAPVAPVPTPGLPPQLIGAVEDAGIVIPAVSSMLLPADAARVFGAMPAVIQRAESAAWRSDRKAGLAFATALSERLDALKSGVRIVHPSGGTYTLASRNSPLPLLVENNLAYPVQVKVRVSSVQGLPGFTASDGGIRQIAANSKLTLKVPTHVERTGRFRVQAVLLTPSGQALGPPILLAVHSTALGVIGVVITIVAGTVLALALLVRFWRRFRQRRRDNAAAVAPMAVAELAGDG